jgi:hypothetical protein
MSKFTLKASIGVYSDKGVKADNEDCYGVQIPDEPQLTHKGIAAVIADGMSVVMPDNLPVIVVLPVF